jgi:hypothetical protein
MSPHSESCLSFVSILTGVLSSRAHSCVHKQRLLKFLVFLSIVVMLQGNCQDEVDIELILDWLGVRMLW